jgi:hypothetical protein
MLSYVGLLLHMAFVSYYYELHNQRIELFSQHTSSPGFGIPSFMNDSNYADQIVLNNKDHEVRKSFYFFTPDFLSYLLNQRFSI